MKNILNKRVKFRESFRPFAAIVLEEDTGKYFDYSKPNPYMLLVYNVKKDFQKILPAITHADETVRIQTVNERENLHMYRLLKKFKEISGHSVLINTSFNISTYIYDFRSFCQYSFIINVFCKKVGWIKNFRIPNIAT